MVTRDITAPAQTVAVPALSSGKALAIAWGFLVALSLATRPVLPVDETRYLGVAWEMWHRGDFLLPTLNGLPYSEKPPLLFWLIHLGWWSFGVSELWPRLVSPLFALGNLFWVRRLAGRLWGSDVPEVRRAPLLLLSLSLWLFFSTVLTFDMMLTFFVLAALDGLLEARERLWGWGQAGLAIGLALLAKGPVALLLILPPALLAPWWDDDRLRGRRIRWNLCLGGAVLAGMALALAWAVPAAIQGGAEYQEQILLGQTSSRILQPTMHAAPWWTYLAWLPLLLLPHSLWPRLWRAPFRLDRSEPGVRFLLAATLPAFVLLSAIGSKRPHYLIPLLPAAALLLAHGLSGMSAERPAAKRSRLTLPLAATGAVGLLLALIGAISGSLAGRIHLPGLAPWLHEIHPGAGLALCALVIYLAVSNKPRSDLVKLTVASFGIFATVHVGLLAVASPAYDMQPVARFVGGLQAAGHPVAFAGHYQGEFQFAGRLTQPVEVVSADPTRARTWLAEHPTGHLIFTYRGAPPPELGDPELQTAYKGQWLGVFSVVTNGPQTTLKP